MFTYTHIVYIIVKTNCMHNIMHTCKHTHIHVHTLMHEKKIINYSDQSGSSTRFFYSHVKGMEKVYRALISI
jgi:hypothetical protein